VAKEKLRRESNMAEATFIQDGDAIDYTPGADVAAGQVVVLSDLIGIAKTAISANVLGALAVEGVFDVAKEGGAAVTFGVGDLAYWDDTNKFAVTTDGGGANKLLGKVVKAAADADTLVRVRIG
jgi:predicted RecA/RadA family phage recombinase